jgi:hypothetical protein
VRLFILLIGLMSAVAASELEPGPVFGDLRLRFQLTTVRKDSIDTHRLRLEVINVSKDPQQVEGYDRSAEGQPFDSLAVYMTKAVNLVSEPQAWNECTKLGDERAGPVCTIPSGQAAVAEWTVVGSDFPSPAIGRVLRLPRPGLYFLRAKLTVKVRSDFVTIWSNEQPCSIEGSKQEVARSTTTLIKFDQGKNLVELAGGTGTGMQVGDVYGVPESDYKPGSAFRVAVEYIGDSSAMGRILSAPEVLLKAPEKLVAYYAQTKLCLMPVNP